MEKSYPNPINYPEIKPDDTDQMLRERCFLYLVGNRGINPLYLDAFAVDAQRLFEFIKTGTTTTPSPHPGAYN